MSTYIIKKFNVTCVFLLNWLLLILRYKVQTEIFDIWQTWPFSEPRNQQNFKSTEYYMYSKVYCANKNNVLFYKSGIYHTEVTYKHWILHRLLTRYFNILDLWWIRQTYFFHMPWTHFWLSIDSLSWKWILANTLKNICVLHYW